jgi:diguanylate cyclase (GGDEF)-like protein
MTQPEFSFLNSLPVASLDSEIYLKAMPVLLSAIQALSLARDMSQVQRLVSSAARKITGCDGVTFVLRDQEKCYYADEDAIAPLWKGKRFPLEQCISGWVMQNKKSAVIEDIYKDSRIPFEAYRPTFVKSLAMVPIRQGNPIGAIGNYWARPYKATDLEVQLLQALADSTSIALENIELYHTLDARVKARTAELEKAYQRIKHLSMSDELTGLHNRRGFYLLGEQFLKERQRDQVGLTLIILDLDGLKTVNDAHGHAAGDEYIQTAAALLRSFLRESDLAARMGGDEFAVLVKGNFGEQLKKRITDTLKRYSLDHQYEYPLSASIGYSEIDNLSAINLFELIKKADCEMYRDKHTAKDLK